MTECTEYDTVSPKKPLGHKSYGTIPHLPGSRQGRDDKGVNPGQARICTESPRKGDTIIVLEKLDGSNVAVANIDGQIVALNRAGYTAISAKWEQHRLFDLWVRQNPDLFDWLRPGERVCGEWLAQVHGTRYLLDHAPFVAFDIIRGQTRARWDEVMERASPTLPTPYMVAESSDGVSIQCAIERLGEYGHHGAIDPVEGAVWRVENDGGVDFLAKFVRSDKVDGKYLPEITGKSPEWNWRPE